MELPSIYKKSVSSVQCTSLERISANFTVLANAVICTVIFSVRMDRKIGWYTLKNGNEESAITARNSLTTLENLL